MDVLLKMVEFSHLVEYPHCCPTINSNFINLWEIIIKISPYIKI